MRLFRVFLCLLVSLLVEACSYRPVSPNSNVIADSQRLSLIQAHILLGQWALAKTQLDQLESSAHGLEYWRLMSLYWLSIGQTAHALLVHEKALTQFPKDDFLLNNYGVLLGQEARWEEACKVFEKASQNGVSRRQSVSINLSRCALRQNDVNLALIYLKQAKEIADLPLIGLMTELNLVLIQGNKDKARLIFNNIQADRKNVQETGYFDEYNCLSWHLTARETDPTLYSSASNFTCLNASRY